MDTAGLVDIDAAPFFFLYTRAPHTLEALTHFKGQLSGSNEFDPYYFGIATGISFSLIAQIGEQVDYLRFMPDKHKGNRSVWWVSMLAAGPGWVVLGCMKQLAGVLLASIAVLTGLAYAEAKEPVQMYYIAYTYVFDHPSLALFVSTVFVVTSQIKINVTNAYAGSLAWSNFFSRVTHAHPGRVVWLVFNIGIALLLMELGVFEALQKVLGLYSNVAIAWISAVVADLTINKILKLSPPLVEFKRAHLYDHNPVGFVSMSVASIVSIIAFTGAFGMYAQAYSWLIAMTISFMLVPIIAKLTKGKYYIARQNVRFDNSDQLCTCGVCDQQYAQTDFAYCTFHDAPICSLCCTLDSSCKDSCNLPKTSLYLRVFSDVLASLIRRSVSKQISFRIANFLFYSGIMLGVVAITFWLAYSRSSNTFNLSGATELRAVLYNLFFILAVLICIATWWIVLLQESQELAETELNEQNETLEQEISAREQAEKFEYFRNHTLEMLAGDNELPNILEAIVLGVEQLNPTMLCSILLMDDEGKHLINGVAPSLPDFYNAAIDGIEIGIGAGSCGTTALTGKRVIVEDIATHPYWTPYKELAASAGLGACWSQPIHSSSGQVLGTFAIYHHTAHTPAASDIYLIEQAAHLASIAIEHASADKALRISENRFKTIFNDAPIGIALIDSLTGHIYTVNPMFAKIAGRTMEEMAHIDWMSITHPDDVQEDLDNMALLNAGKISGFQMQKRYLHHDGTPVWINMTITPIYVKDKAHPRHLCMIEDITERKRAENELYLAKEAAEQALAEQRQFIAMVSHEFRSPLAVIDSAAQLLVTKLSAESGVAPILARIRRGVSRLSNFIGNCMTEDRLDSATLILHPFSLDLHALAVSVIENAQHISMSHEITAELAPDLPLLNADPQLLSILLINLLDNAIKYSPVGSKVRLRIKHTGYDCSFEVIDQGMGIPADELPLIFKKYIRGRATASISGAGLGLSLVSRILALHGGSIKMESIEGEGSHITVTIPLTDMATHRHE